VARALVVPLGLTLKTEVEDAGDEPRHYASLPGGSNGMVDGPTFRILMVGRMSKAEYYMGFRDATDLYKGFKQLILAVGQLSRQVPGARLWIVGDGDARPDLEQWIAGRSERDFVDFLGRVSDKRLEQLYQASDVFALPSEGEGFGLVFVEAMAHGLPCVCVNAGAAPEVVHDGETGLVARPRDVADLADKLLVLAKNTVLHTRLSNEARRTYAERFTAQAFEERIFTALASVS
jgi:phosphatidylinositol alpha-1,6-mannosyltransferase